MIARPQSSTFTVSNGDLVLLLEPAENGWYAVSSPTEPHLHTQARSIEDAFDMAYDALESLHAARAKYQDAIAQVMAAS